MVGPECVWGRRLGPGRQSTAIRSSTKDPGLQMVTSKVSQLEMTARSEPSKHTAF
jgi:hypothetical protein